jgi:putative ABC transport system ATP-binding protein
VSGPVLEIERTVEFSYPGLPGVLFAIPVGLTLERGHVYSTLGQNGIGKSTFLALLAAFRTFSSGRVALRLGGSVFSVGPDSEVRSGSPDIWKYIGFAFQSPTLFKFLTIEENILMSGAEISGDIQEFVAIGGDWQAIRDRRPIFVSGGQVQRVSVVRAFGRDKHLVFIDEPTNNLDVKYRERCAAFVAKRVNDGGPAVVVVSHDQDFLATLRGRIDVGCFHEFYVKRECNGDTLGDVERLERRELTLVEDSIGTTLGDENHE